MRVLHINCNFTGNPLHENMINSLRAAGIDGGVYAPVCRECGENFGENITVSHCFKKADRLFFGLKQKKIIKDIGEKTDIKSFDLIHAHTLFTDGNCAFAVSKKYKIPYIVAVRSTDLNIFFRFRPYLIPRAVKILRGAASVVFLSNAYRERLINNFVPEKYKAEIESKSRVIPNGINDFWLESPAPEKSSPKDEIKLLFVGRFNKNKNIKAVVKAAKILRKRGFNVSLTAVGGGKLKIKADFLTVEPRRDMRLLLPLYRESDIFVMPSYRESFGVVYAEAMSQGVPVIYTRGEGFDGRFPEGEVGFPVDPHSPKEIASAIMKITENYKIISQNAQKRAKQFRWSAIALDYKSLYGRALGDEK